MIDQNFEFEWSFDQRIILFPVVTFLYNLQYRFLTGGPLAHKGT